MSFDLHGERIAVIAIDAAPGLNLPPAAVRALGIRSSTINAFTAFGGELDVELVQPVAAARLVVLGGGFFDRISDSVIRLRFAIGQAIDYEIYSADLAQLVVTGP